MSGDVQPRKRKDKKRKKDSTSSDRSRIDAEFIARKLSLGDDSDEGVSIPVKSSSSHSSSQLGEGDSIIHVHHEGGTGGHWCAKIVFFFLLGILVFLIGLILIENRGLTDLDTPTESRYAQVFDGWVDEGPIHDDHHDEHTLELKHGDEDSHEDDDHDEEHDEEIEDIEDEHGDTEDEDEHTEDEGIGSDEEHADDDNDEDEADNDQDQVIEEDDDENNNDGGEDDDEDEGHNSNELDNDEDENDDDEDDVKKDSGENDEEENLHEIDYDGEGEDDDYLGASQENDDDDDDAEGEDSQLNDSREGDLDNAPFEEVDSMEEEVIENNAGEEEHLAAKKAEQLAQEQEDSGIGMRVGIGVALVVVAYCVLARKWQNVSPDVDDELLGDLNRRMTLISDEEVTDEVEKEVEEQIPVVKKNVSIVETAPTPSFFARPAKQIVHRYEEDEDEEIPPKEKIVEKKTITEEKLIQKPKEELPVQESAEKKDEQDEEEIDYEEDIEEVEEITREEIKNIETEYGDDGQDVEDEVEDDEILDEEIVDEELLDEEDIEDEDEEDEEEIDDDDDTDLMKKLEEKYGKLPEKISDDQPEGHSDDEVPVTPARKRGKPSGGNSVDDQEEWFDDTSDHWKQQLDLAQAEMDEGHIEEAYRLFTALSMTNKSCPLAKLGLAKVMDVLAEKKRSNNLLQATIDAYLEVLKMDIQDKVFADVANRTINRIRFKGKHLDAVPVHEMLISKFPADPQHRNELAITYLMVNKINFARKVLQETLDIWPYDAVALVHYGFILKTVDNNLTEGVKYMQKGIDLGDNRTLEGRFLFHLGDAFARLGDIKKSNEIYELGASKGVFLSSMQRSLYNVDRLTGRPWWNVEQTPYGELMKELESHWNEIASEAKRLHPHYKPEQENLKDTGFWSQYELFVRGVEIKDHCAKCPITCSIIRKERAAYGCRRGQIKFSAMNPGTHVFAHTGPTNCRLRAHLGLIGTNGTFIRVARETRSWEQGKVFIFDDSFEHEVWHNGTELRIVLILDLWHPELTKEEHLSLPAI